MSDDLTVQSYKTPEEAKKGVQETLRGDGEESNTVGISRGEDGSTVATFDQDGDKKVDVLNLLLVFYRDYHIVNNHDYR